LKPATVTHFFSSNSYWYYLVVALQGFCVYQVIRRGNPYYWIFLIIFLPVVGSLIYLFTEVVSFRDMSNVQENVGTFINPAGKIRKLEEQLRFSDTFKNKVLLADAYAASGNPDKAIELYEACLNAAIPDSHVFTQLMICYFAKGRHADVVKIGNDLKNAVEFRQSRAKLFYALSLEKIGDTEQAEQQFKTMNGRFSNHESRINYGLFLVRNGRIEEAKGIFIEMLDEVSHLTGREKRANRAWYTKAKEELEKLNTPVSVNS